jgi:hypothetical protein
MDNNKDVEGPEDEGPEDEDHKEICEGEDIYNEKCSICKKTLYSVCGPSIDEDENAIVIACNNGHRFHKYCIMEKNTTLCPFPDCKQRIKANINELEVVTYDTLYDEYLKKIEKKGGRKKRKSVRKIKKRHQKRTRKRRTYRRK